MPDLVRFASRSMVRLPDIYGWVTVTRFDIDGSASDADILAALIKTKEFEGPGYERHEPSAEDKRRITEIGDRTIKKHLAQGGKVRILPRDRTPLHGPYRLSAITVDAYQPTTPRQAHDELEDWARDYEEPAAEVSSALARDVYPALDVPRLYALADLGPRAMSNNPFGLWLFTEFVAINPDELALSLIIAAYD